VTHERKFITYKTLLYEYNRKKETAKKRKKERNRKTLPVSLSLSVFFLTAFIREVE
jgi:hypothetical protein